MSNTTQKTINKINIPHTTQELDDEISKLESENFNTAQNITEINQKLYEAEDDIIKRKSKILEKINKIQPYNQESKRRFFNRANDLNTDVNKQSHSRQIRHIRPFHEENNRKLRSLSTEYTETTETERTMLKGWAQELIEKEEDKIKVNIIKIDKLQEEKKKIQDGSSGGSNKKSGGKRKNITKKRKYKKKRK